MKEGFQKLRNAAGKIAWVARGLPTRLYEGHVELKRNVKLEEGKMLMPGSGKEKAAMESARRHVNDLHDHVFGK